MRFKFLRIVVFLFVQTLVFGQNLENIGKADLFKLTGGISANSVFSSNQDFTYYIAANANINISGVYNIPFTFSYSNSKFQSNNPFKFNRLSIHPSYKWVTAHIGDVSMNFSPYTLSGHQFTGIGLDVTPNNQLKVSMMYGRLLKKNEYDSKNPTNMPYYKRIGYGVKASYRFSKIALGAILFKANDINESLDNPIPLELGIVPKDNIVAGFDSDINITESVRVKAEIAFSSITNKLSSLKQTNTQKDGVKRYKAYNIGVFYQIGRGNLGIRYEYIDPEYKTLGGYFFNNDLENITINATQQLFEGKLSIAINAGLQRDDLDNKKNAKLKRMVSSVNLGVQASDRINFSMGYSSFKSHTYLKNQFDEINRLSHIETFDLSDIVQLSQNANLNSNFILKNTKNNKQSISIGLSFQSAINKLGEKEHKGDNTSYYNANMSYNFRFPKQHMSVSLSANSSYNITDIDKNFIFGPILSVSKKFFKELGTRMSLGYNKSMSNGINQGEIINFRLGSNYSYKKKHNFSIRMLSQLRNYKAKRTNNFMVTLGYNYVFDAISSKKIFKK